MNIHKYNPSFLDVNNNEAINFEGILPKYFIEHKITGEKYIFRDGLWHLCFHKDNPNILDMIFYWWTKKLCIFNEFDRIGSIF
jgi:hypothetical protein